MKKSNLKLAFGAAALACGLALSAPANATLILQTGLVGGSGDVSNVIFNTCGLGSSSGMMVQGCLNTSTTTLVNFTATETLSISGGGQAVISASDGTLTSISIALANPTMGFSKLQFNLDAIVNGNATFQAVDQFGTVFNFGSFALTGTGQNFFTLGSLDGQVAKSLSITSTTLQNIANLEQVRVGAAAGSPRPVSEPGSLALLGLSLLGVGFFTRRKNARLAQGPVAA